MATRYFKPWCVYVRQRQYLFDTFDDAVTFGADNPDFRGWPRVVFERKRYIDPYDGKSRGIASRHRFYVKRDDDGRIVLMTCRPYDMRPNVNDRWVVYDATFGIGG